MAAHKSPRNGLDGLEGLRISDGSKRFMGGPLKHSLMTILRGLRVLKLVH